MEEESFWQGPSSPVWVWFVTGVVFAISLVAWLLFTLEHGVYEGWLKAKVLGWILVIPVIILFWLTEKSEEE